MYFAYALNAVGFSRMGSLIFTVSRFVRRRYLFIRAMSAFRIYLNIARSPICPDVEFLRIWGYTFRLNFKSAMYIYRMSCAIGQCSDGRLGKK